MKATRASFCCEFIQAAVTGRRYVVRVGLALFVTALTTWFPIGAKASTTNVIANPGFESGSLGPWIISDNWCGFDGDGPCSPWEVSSTDSHDGNSSLEDMGDVEVVQYFKMTPGSSVSDASFWLKQDPALMFAYELFYIGGADSFNVVMPSSNDWEEYNIASSIDSNGLLYGIGFVNYSANGPNSNGPAWLDDVVIDSSFEAVRSPEPTPLTLTLGGLACLAVIRRSVRTNWRNACKR